MAKLIITNTYFSVFSTLVKELEGKAGGLTDKNLVFCEEKVSLMTERFICAQFKGSFNTQVYSFGNFLRVHKHLPKTLSKEGSAMAVKRILSGIQLNCLSRSKQTLAPTLFELIAQLKSASVLPEDLKNCLDVLPQSLKNKIEDVAEVYAAYERFIAEQGYDDQSSSLSYLPELIEKSNLVKGANVYLVGFVGWTAQTRKVILSLLKKARSVTAILTGGKNQFVYLNETIDSFKDLCARSNQPLTIAYEQAQMPAEANRIVQNVFNPSSRNLERTPTDAVCFSALPSVYAETERVAGIIKKAVIDGKCRYRDVSVIIPDVNIYKEDIKRAFTLLDLPFFIDERKKPLSHPLVKLISAYVDIFRKGMEKELMARFYKNPLICPDKEFADAFETFILKNSINYNRFNDPLPLGKKPPERYEEFEAFRARVCELLNGFNVRALLEKIDAEQALALRSAELNGLCAKEAAAVNDQIYKTVTRILDEMDLLLHGISLDYTEFKNIFMSGVSAMEVSILPQYNDAVFVGDFKEVALAQAKYVFALGMTADVPAVQEDVALLSDADINALSKIKVMVEPKIKVVNHRLKESVVLGLAAFQEKLFLSMPVTSVKGEPNVRSEIISYLDRYFDLKPLPEVDEYVTEKQGLKTYARTFGEFSRGLTVDTSKAAAFYNVSNNPEVERIMEQDGKEVKLRLDKNAKVLVQELTSPSYIENYHKCPYKMFAQSALRLNERDEGRLSSASAGTLMHAIFKEYVEQIDKVKDEQTSNALVDQIADEVLSRDEFSAYTKEGAGEASVRCALEECKKYCYRMFVGFKEDAFKAVKGYQEVGFGVDKKCKYPPISLLGGKIKLKGTIDRVDFYKDYCRIIDYKTGGYNCSEEGLYTGTGLQLYLYALAVKDKTPAGMYYYDIKGDFTSGDKEKANNYDGKTLNADLSVSPDKAHFNAIKKGDAPISVYGQEVTKAMSTDDMKAHLQYALEISERAASRMAEGVIVPSPYHDTCKFCALKPMCEGVCGRELPSRQVKGVKEQTIKKAIFGDVDNRTDNHNDKEEK